MTAPRLEAGTRHVLAWCPSCPPWRVIRGTRPAAHLAAADHAERVHGDAAAAKEHRRRARDTQNGVESPTAG